MQAFGEVKMMKIRKKRCISDRMFVFCVVFLAIIATAVTLYPFIYIFSASISSPTAVNRGEVLLWPVGFSIAGYEKVIANNEIWMSYGNTLFYTVAGTFCSLIATAIGAYPLSRRQYCLRKPLNFLITFSMYFSGGLIPTYLIISRIGLYNNRWVMILPSLISSYNLMVCRSAFSAIPEEIMESAQIDGANDLRIFSGIAIHLITPTLAVLTLYYAVGKWNDFFTALLYLSKSNLVPLQVILRRVLIMASNEMMNDASRGNPETMAVNLQVRYATIIVSTLPILFVYPFVQRFFVKGVMLGAVKG